MAKRQSFQILQKTFQTKAELKDFTKAILNKYELNITIAMADFTFISELLKRHPEYELKIGSGIRAIIIRTDGNWKKTRCFHIQRTDGTETDFSYINCIDNDTSKEPMRMFKLSARSAIEEQIVSYLSSYISRTKDNNDFVVCQKSQTKIHKGQATVDHIPPITFDKIVTDFLRIKSIDPSQIDYMGFGDNEYNKEFKEENLRTEFADYHRQVAKLRVISKQENLTQKKKNFNEQIAFEY